MKRTRFLAGVAAGAATCAVRLPATAEGSKILVGYWPIAAALPFYVGAQMGYFKDAGVEVELVKFADQVKVTEALLAGRIDATATGTGSTQLALAEVASPNFFKIVAANLSSEKSILDEIIVAKGAPYKKIFDLKGKKFATGVGPQAVIEAKMILAKNGLADMPVQELSPSQHIAAIVGGQIDAAYTYEPNGTVGRLNGTIDVLEVGVRSKYMLGDGNAPWYGGAAVISSEFMKNNPAVTKRYLIALHRAFGEVRKNINQARAVYPAYTSFDVKLSEAIPAISYTLYDEFKKSDVGYLQKNFDIFFDQKVFTRRLDAASLIYKG
jgi:NitT/TauT family transport system substrate-binding protein